MGDGNTGVEDDALPAVPDENENANETDTVADSDETEIPGVDNADTETKILETPGGDNGEDAEEEIPGVNHGSQEELDNIPMAEAETGIRRSERTRQKNKWYSEEAGFVQTTISKDKVNVMNPKMFSNAAVDKATGFQRSKGIQRSKANTKPNNITCNVFATCGDELQMDDQILLLNLDATNDNGYDESIMAQTDAEWLFLTEHLGWSEGLQCEQHDIDQEDEYLFTTDQMNWKKGLKVFGEKGEDAIQKELQQIHDMEGFQPKHWYELTKEERADALKYLMYLKEKRDGRIKGRGCADGRKQRAYIHKAEASSPTATLQGIMLTCMIDAYERRDVATVDIPGAFLQTKMPEEDRAVHVVLDGRMAELLAKISPDDYQEFVHQHRGQSHIYCKLNVSLYGTNQGQRLCRRQKTACLYTQGRSIFSYGYTSGDNADVYD